MRGTSPSHQSVGTNRPEVTAQDPQQVDCLAGLGGLVDAVEPTYDFLRADGA